MRIENAFAVRAPVPEVWNALLDVERVAPCVPGAEVLERIGDDAYRVAVKLKLGPLSMSGQARVEIVARDEQARTATLRAEASGPPGQKAAGALIQVGLSEQARGTHAKLETELRLSGKAAAVGEGVIADVAQTLIDTFAVSLDAALARDPGQSAVGAVPAGVAMPVGKLAVGVVARRLRDPRRLVGAMAALALLVAALRRALRAGR